MRRPQPIIAYQQPNAHDLLAIRIVAQVICSRFENAAWNGKSKADRLRRCRKGAAEKALLQWRLSRPLAQNLPPPRGARLVSCPRRCLGGGGSGA